MIQKKFVNGLLIYYLILRYFRGQWANPDRRIIKQHRAEFYANAWKDAANQTGSDIEMLDDGIFRITNGDVSFAVYQHYTPLIDPALERLILNKIIINKFLTGMNVPIPRYIHLKNFDIPAVNSFMSGINGPVVVKPASGTAGGDGVVTNITNSRRLYRALAWSEHSVMRP